VTLAMRILTGKLIRHCRDLIVERSYPETAVTSGEFGGLVGIEPTTPSMPWNSQNYRADGKGFKSRTSRQKPLKFGAFCCQDATKTCATNLLPN
jgi:hypothetical protein